MRILVLIFLCGLASDFLLSQELFRGENLLVKPPKTSEYKGFHKESGGLKSTTWISNENSTKDTFTVNILSGNRLDLERFRDIQDQPGREACSEFSSLDINDLERNGYKSLFWETSCTLNDTSIRIIQLAILGRDSLYHLRKLWRIPVEADIYSSWRKKMEEISVCDTRWNRKKKHPCPKDLSKVDD